MKPLTLSPAARSRIALVVLVCVALLMVVALGQSNVGASAMKLFQSQPSSPLTTPSAPTPVPAATATQPQGSEATASGPAIPTWLAIVAAVVVLAVVAIFVLLRLRR